MIYNHAIQLGGRLTLYNADTSQNIFRSHPLFTIDDRANLLLENNISVAQDLQTMARTIEKEVTIGTDMPEGSKWEEEDEQNSHLDCDEILEDVYNEKNEAYKVFQLARCVRELAKNIADGTYYMKDMHTLKEVSCLLIDAHNKLLTTKTASGLPELKRQVLQYKTLKELSKPPTFKGKFLLTKHNLCVQLVIFFSSL